MTTDEARGKPNAVPPDHPVAGIEEDHSSVRDHIEEIAAARTCAALVAALDGLPAELEAHFAREESDEGYFADIGQRRPAVSPQLQAFRDEHRAMLEQLEGVCGQLADRGEGADEEIPPPIHDAVTQWLEKLRGHELEESRIIADVYYSDEGGYG